MKAKTSDFGVGQCLSPTDLELISSDFQVIESVIMSQDCTILMYQQSNTIQKVFNHVSLSHPSDTHMCETLH